MSKLKPILLKHNVRLVAIGMKESIDDFIDEGYFTGDLFFDEKLESYRSLRLKSAGFGSILASMLPMGTHQAAYKLAGKIPQNTRNVMSHGTQLGATYIVDVGGDVILEHRQNSIGDFLDNADILHSLGIDSRLAPPSGSVAAARTEE
eukprot:m.591614 g.591614  ORF g.591614 m.591614 type:complete len:148 (+) comp22381_c0_seq4:727-1170(+)